MKAIVLAAGYATRLRPLTDTIAKPLLPVGGRPMVDWICDRIRAVDAVDAVHVVTNSRYAADFARWAEGSGAIVHDDGTSSNEDRLGAIGDIAFVLDRVGIDDLLVIAGDNLFEFDLAELVGFAAERRGSAVAVYDCGDPALATQYGIVEVDESGRMIGFEEKPQRPRSTLASTACYAYAREHAALIPSYLAEGNLPDQPGRFVDWLYRREPVYGFRFDGDWFDVGDEHQLLEADNRLRRVVGLPERAAYSPEP